MQNILRGFSTLDYFGLVLQLFDLVMSTTVYILLHDFILFCKIKKSQSHLDWSLIVLHIFIVAHLLKDIIEASLQDA